MSLFRRRPDQPEQRSWSMNQLARYQSYVTSSTGRIVTVDQSLRSAAVWACVDVLAGSVSELPVDVVRYRGSVREPVRSTPPIIAKPSAMSTLDVWLYQLMWSMLIDGNAFGMVVDVDPTTQRPTQIELLDPAKVTDRRVDAGVATASVDGAVHRLFPFGDLWHVPGKMVQPGSPFGLSTVKYAANAIDAALSAEEFGGRFFTDGGHPTALIRAESDLGADQAQQVKDAFMRAVSGRREPLVMGSGLDYEPIQINPSDSQFLDLMRFEVEQVCRFFRVPPSMVYGAVSGQSVTYANVSQADLAYLKHSLDGYLVRIERALTELLPRPQVVKFNREALLRADAETRMRVHELRLANKLATVNEIRVLEDEQPFEGEQFDQPGVPGAGEPAQPTTEAVQP